MFFIYVLLAITITIAFVANVVGIVLYVKDPLANKRRDWVREELAESTFPSA